ncbi:MAG: hypothetical protein EXR60_03850 [Dehalococcoidia bacterium]|nr:hypothetical protein [Dehalococcoidia bacterium]
MSPGEDEFDRILDDCLDRLLRGESVESCLGGYPRQALELEPLLRAALQVQRGLSLPLPPEQKAQARLRLAQTLQERAQRPRRRWLAWPHLARRWAMAASVALVFALVAGAGAGTVAASANTTPDQPLYGVKRKAESVRIFLSVGAESKANNYARQVDQRLGEMARMVESGRPREVELLGDALKGHLERIQELAGAPGLARPGPRKAGAPDQRGAAPSAPALSSPDSAPGTPAPQETALPDRVAALTAMLERNVEQRRSQLLAALETAPPEARPRILRALALTEERHRQALEEIKRRASEAERERRKDGMLQPKDGTRGDETRPPRRERAPSTGDATLQPKDGTRGDETRPPRRERAPSTTGDATLQPKDGRKNDGPGPRERNPGPPQASPLSPGFRLAEAGPAGAGPAGAGRRAPAGA